MTTLYIVLGLVLALALVGGVVLFVMLRLGGTVEAEVYAAIEQGQYQFVALMEQTTPETKEQDLAHMKRYNDFMYETLKEEGKLHLIEEQVEIVRKNLGKEEA